MRLRLKALAARDAKAPVRVDAATRAAVLALLGDAGAAREQADMLINYAAEIVRAAEREGHRRSAAQLLAAFDAALQRLEADATMSRADRMQALIARSTWRASTCREGDAASERQAAAPVPQLPAAAARRRARAGRARRPRDHRRLRAPGRHHRGRLPARARRPRPRVRRPARRPTWRRATRPTT